VRWFPERLLPTAGMAAGLVVFLWAGLQMSRKVEPYWTWYYCFAWWSYILFFQSLLHRRGGDSMLFRRPSRFFLLSLFSINLWLVFETWNFRLNNWEYHNVPPGTFTRWVGYAVSFATVIPGIFTTQSLLDHLRVLEPGRPAKGGPSPRFHQVFLGVGGLFLLLPLIWPRHFFPLVWGGFVFLLEPINYRLGAPSLLRQWEEGSLRTFYLLLAAGLVCGFLWEFWNFWAGTKWQYTIPHVGRLKIFEMPILGFLGFPPFAVECYVMTSSFLALCRRIGEEGLGQRRFRLRFLLGAGMVAWDLLIFHGIDLFTVASFSR